MSRFNPNGPTPIGRRFIDPVRERFNIPFVSMSARVDEVVRTLGFVPPALAGAMRAGLYDYINHHRNKMLSRVGRDFAAGRRAIRMMASRTSGYVKWNEEPVRMGDMTAELFMASREGTDAPIGFQELLLFEQGGSINSAKPMAIPIGAGLPRKSGPFQNLAIWNQGANVKKGGLRQFTFITRNGKTYIIDDRDASIKRRNRRGEEELSPIVGVLRRGRTQPKKLRFYATAMEIRDSHARKFDRLVELALSEAGRAELATRDAEAVAKYRAGRDVFRAAVATGISFREAREMMKAARKAVARQSLELAVVGRDANIGVVDRLRVAAIKGSRGGGNA